MSKKCDGCGEAYKGFGSTCANCRRRPSDPSLKPPPAAGSGVPADHCEACGKRVYAMETHSVEGHLFHKDCFKCTTCGRKLAGGDFGKNELGTFCLAHFHQITKVTGGYKTGTGPTRNANAASLVDAMIHRGESDITSAASDGQTGAGAMAKVLSERAQKASATADLPTPVPTATPPTASTTSPSTPAAAAAKEVAPPPAPAPDPDPEESPTAPPSPVAVKTAEPVPAPEPAAAPAPAADADAVEAAGEEAAAAAAPASAPAAAEAEAEAPAPADEQRADD